jgi:hypothetical protein
MINYAQTPVAWALTRGMAYMLKVDLGKAAMDGWLTRTEVDALVATCEACPQKTACSQWLKQAHGAPCVAVFCPNQQRIEALALRM